MLVWGWRIPFLLSIFTVLSAAILRYNMPESSEFTASREEIEEDVQKRQQHKAAEAHSSDSQADSSDGHVSIVDVEGQNGAKKARYVPVLELFRGYWSGLLLHSLYGTCECKPLSACRQIFCFWPLHEFVHT